MLTKKQVKEIRDHLEKAQNPLFFFDNDADGLCSFLLLQRYLGRGKGFPLKSSPELTKNYIRKIDELGIDYVFVLDKPIIEKEFWEKIHEKNVPIVWIDHHGIKGDTPNFVNFYDPVLNKPSSNEPVTALCYQVTGKKEDLWIALAGCVADHYLPDFYKDFKKSYPDLAINTKKPFDVLYNSEFGRLIKIMSSGLKDRTTNVITMLKFLMKVKTPYEVLEESSKNHLMHKRFKEVDRNYRALLDGAKKLEKKSDKVLFFKYSSELSISGELANELSYLFPDKFIVVAHIKGLKVNLSCRGKNVREKFLRVIEKVETAKGGGHLNAVGGQLNSSHLEEFKRNFEDIV